MERARTTGGRSNEEKANAVKVFGVRRQILAENVGESFSPHLKAVFPSIIRMLHTRNLQIRKESLWTIQSLMKFVVTYWSRPTPDGAQRPLLLAVSENLADEAIHAVLLVMQKCSEAELTGMACRTLVGIFEVVGWNFMKGYLDLVTRTLKDIMDNNIDFSVALELENVEYLLSSLLNAVCTISKLWKDHRVSKDELDLRLPVSNTKIFRNFFDEIYPSFLEWSSTHQPMWMQRLALGATGIVFTDIAVSQSSLDLERYAYHMLPVLNSSLSHIHSKFSMGRGKDVDMRLVQNAAACCGIIGTHVREAGAGAGAGAGAEAEAGGVVGAGSVAGAGAGAGAGA
eukprot:768769-Hanusia_phi.AAC.1